ncbi:MAG: phosphohydrolase [Flavobacterium sp. BFFFF2]|nr:MAG: phosphohydrolase [Flavobacterium sp. BFFFF2]
MQDSIVSKTIQFVRDTLAEAEGGHDWFHIERVYKSAINIANHEAGANLLIVQLASLLHDIADSKFHGGDEKIGPEKARQFLESQAVEAPIVEAVIAIIENMSFHKSIEGTTYQSLELDIVQDADRLDAIGAIGIARTFNYGGFKNRKIYDPAISPQFFTSKESYKKSDSPTLNHFYEKLLLLKDLMTTPTAQAMAEQRHAFMEAFLSQFYAEWEGEF